MSNEDERRNWSGPAGRMWIDREAEQDRLLAEVAETVLRRATIVPRERILDIGCGTGALTVSAAERVGPEGHVLAVDIAAPFVARARERASAFPQVRVVECDAATAEWPLPPFDAAISRFGTLFFSDPPAALANIRRALAPGGRMVFAAWAPADENPLWRIPREVAARHVGAPPEAQPGAPGPMAWDDPERTLGFFRAAGIPSAECETVAVTLWNEGGSKGLADLVCEIGSAARVLNTAEASERQRRETRADLAAALAPFEEAGRAGVPGTILLYVAQIA